MTKVSDHAWFNGEIVPREASAPSIASISLHLGTGVFDGLMAYWNDGTYYLHRAEEHFARFKRGASRLGLTFPWTVDLLLEATTQLLDCEPKQTHYIRPIAYRRAPELWITGSEGKPVDVSIFAVPVSRNIDTPLTCHISPVERVSDRAIPGHTKVSGAYVNSFNARRTAEIAGFNDGIMLDREGRITEASAANLFVIRDDKLLTPPANPDVFPGVTRQVVLELAHDAGIDTQEVDLRPDDLLAIEGAFLCSTLMEIRPLSRIDRQEVATSANAIYDRLLGSFRQLTSGPAC